MGERRAVGRNGAAAAVVGSVLSLAALVPAAAAQSPLRRMGELELRLLGASAIPDPLLPVVPRNVAAGLRVIVRAGGRELGVAEVERFLGGPFHAEAEVSGPGLRETLTVPNATTTSADPLLVPLPPISVPGDHRVSNLRLVVGGRSVLDATPREVPLRVIDQVLVTSVVTRALTLDEIRERGIVLDSDDYLGFEFRLGLRLDSQVVQFEFPAVFDRTGLPLPLPLSPPAAAQRELAALAPTILPLLLEPVVEGSGEGGGERPPVITDEQGRPVRIPSVVVIPGNVGYLRQFFSAQLYVANGAPAGSSLVLDQVAGTIRLPPGADLEPGTADDPLSLPDTLEGPQPTTLPIRGVGPDGEPGTPDDVPQIPGAEQGQAEFLVRGDLEGFHRIDFDILADLLGVPGREGTPIRLQGVATGGVLVRNPYFDVTFTVPSVVRAREPFRLVATVANIGQGTGSDVRVSLDASRMSGARLLSESTRAIPTLAPGDARAVEFLLEAERTGQVVASYLRFETASGQTGELRFTLGVGERGVPLSPDTLALPASLAGLPPRVADEAMRVLGQAWSVANAPAGSLRPGVLRPTRAAVTEKALALAEAGLRVTLGQAVEDAVRDLALDFLGGPPLDPGLDQVLRQTLAAQDLRLALGEALRAPMQAAGGLLSYERSLAEVAASGPDFVSVAVASSVPVQVSLTDPVGRRTAAGAMAGEVPPASAPGVSFLPLGTTAPSYLGRVAEPAPGPHVLEAVSGGTGWLDLSATLPRANGSFSRGWETSLQVRSGTRLRLTMDATAAEPLLLETDAEGDGIYEGRRGLSLSPISPAGARLVSAHVVGPETLQAAAPFGRHVALVFDRVVEAESAADQTRYDVPGNRVLVARRVLSGRLAFLTLEAPEGPYVATTLSTSGVADARGVPGPGLSVPLPSRITDAGAVVTGRVLQADGTPVPGASIGYLNQIDLTCATLDVRTVTSLLTDGDGRYELRYVRQDNCGTPFTVATRDPDSGSLRRTERFVRAAGETIHLDVVLFGRGAVTGVVRDLQARPVAGARVTVVSGTDPQVGGATTTDAGGRYQVAGITVGPVSVRAAAGISAGRAAGRIDRAGTTATVDVTLDGGAVNVAGTVRKVQAGVTAPLPGVQVVYFLVAGPDPVAVGVAQADMGGRYRFTGMPAGAHRIEAGINGRDRGSVTGVASAGDDLTGRDILIAVPDEVVLARVRGSVLLLDGSPASGAVVAHEVAAVVADGAGRYELSGLPVRPGQSQLVRAFSRDGRRTGLTHVLLQQPGQVVEGADITLSGLGAAELTVLDAAGAPMASQTVRLLGAGCADPCGCAARTTGPDGRARFEGLPLSPVLAKAFVSAGGTWDAAEVSVSIPGDGATGFGILRFQGFGVVSGLVEDPSGGPLHGADVALRSYAFVNDGQNTCGLVLGTSHRVQTDTQGRFRIPAVHVGPVSLLVTHPFFTSSAGAQGYLQAAGQELAFTVRLAHSTTGELSGLVTLPDGVTPAGAGVEVSVTGPLPTVVVQTNDLGRYRFARVLPQGTYRLQARDPVTGGVVEENVFLRTGQDAAHDLRLKGKGRVRVRVVDGADQEVASAFVRLAESEFPRQVHEGVVEPANGGVVSLEGVNEGRFTVTASDVFARGGRAESVLPGPGAEVEVRVRLTTTGSVLGRFLAVDGLPIPNGTAVLRGPSGVLGQATTASAGQIGSFAFDYVPAGPVRVEAQDPLNARTGFAVGTLESEGQVLDLEVRAQAMGAVEGVVRSNGAPQPLAHVDVVSGNYRACTLADGSGRYLVEGVPEGQVVVTASLDAGFLAGTASAPLAGEGTRLTLDVALRDSGTITGRVLGADGTTPEAAALVTLAPTAARLLTAATDADGRFSFTRVPAGPAVLVAEVLGGVNRGSASVQVPAGGAADVPVRLVGVGRLRGQALDSAGQGVGGWVTLFSTGPVGWPHAFAFALPPDGRFELPEVLATPFSVLLRSGPPGLELFGSAAGAVTPGALTEVTVRLQPSGTVTGVVLRPGGALPAYGAEVAVTASQRLHRAQAQTDGRFTVRGVPLGGLSVTVTDPLTGGRMALRGLGLADNGQVLDLGPIVLDVEPPTLRLLAPADGSSRPGFGGPLRVEATDASGIDAASAVVTYTAGGQSFSQQGGLALSGGVLSGSLQGDWIRLGSNRVTVFVRDLAGNGAEGSALFAVTGNTLGGRVLGPGGAAAAGAALSLTGPEGGSLSGQTAPDGRYSFTGLRPGRYTVTATDPMSGLLAALAFDVADGGDSLAPDLTLPAYGRLRGLVRRASGLPAAGVVVTAATRSAVADAAGAFDLGLLPLGSFAVSASDPTTLDRGRASASLTAHGQVAEVTIALNGVGSATVRVLTAAGAPVAGATVELRSSSPLAEARTASTGPDGTSPFASVLAGQLTAQAVDPATGLVGSATAALLDGGAASIEVTLEPPGRVEGTVRRVDGAPAAGVAVEGAFTRPGGAEPLLRAAVSDAAGGFAFDGVPPSSFVLTAAEAGTGDRGTASGAVSGDTVRADVTLQGVGTVRVVVTQAGGTPAAGALVAVAASLSQQYQAVAGADGRAEVPRVLAGPIAVTATRDGFTGQASAVLAPGGTVEVAVALPAQATIRGRVLQPDGVTPAGGAPVGLGTRVTTSSADGSFAFAALPLGTYALEVRIDGLVRATAGGIVLAADGQVVTRDLVLSGLGEVSGLVRDAAAQPVPGALVQVQAAGLLRSLTTAADGAFRFPGLPVGVALAVTASRDADRAEATAQLTAHGQVASLDIVLVSSAVALPAMLADWNQFAWQAQPDGRATAPFGGGPGLSLVRSGAALAFTGSPGLVPTEESRREIVTHQDGLHGLSVVRKTYVPSDGYFTRALDRLINAGTAPVTLDVLLSLALPGISRVVDSSSGDATADVADRWLLLDDQEGLEAMPSVASVLSGAGGLAPSSVDFSGDPAGRTATYRWDGVTVPAGGSVSFLHLMTAAPDATRGRAAAQRLEGIPPEVLAGLSPEEAATMANFLLPPDGQSLLPPLPPLDGVVTGRLLTGDGTLPVAGLFGTLRSRSPYHHRALATTQTGPDGAWRATGVPRQAFDVSFTLADSLGSRRADAAGDFPTSGVVDLTSMTGRAVSASSSRCDFNASTGTVVCHPPEHAVDGDPATAWLTLSGDAASPPHNATPYFEVAWPQAVTLHRLHVRGASYRIRRARVEAFDGAGAVAWNETVDLLAPNGDLDLPVAPVVPGVRRLRLTSVLDVGSAVGVAELATLGEGSVGPSGRASLDLSFAGAGVVAGRVLRSGGSAAAGARVTLAGPAGTAEWWTDAAGSFTFPVVPASDYTLTATHPLGGVSAAANVTVAAGQRATRDLVFPALGAVQGTLRRASGVAITGGARLSAPGFARDLTTIDGSYLFEDVPPGTYQLGAEVAFGGWSDRRPLASMPVTVAEGQTTTADVSLPPMADVIVRATSGGSPLAGGIVRWDSETVPGLQAAGATDALGALRITSVPGPGFRVRVEDSPGTPQLFGEQTGTVVADGQTLSVAVEVPVGATVTGAVRSRAGEPRTGHALELRVGEWRRSVTVDASGGFARSRLPLGTGGLVAWAGRTHPELGAVSHRAQAVLTLSQHGLTVAQDALVPEGVLAAPGEVDLWVLPDVPAGATVDILLEGLAAGATPALADPYLEAFGPDGALLAANDDRTPADRSAHVTFVAPLGGAHHVVVRGAGSTAGGYRLGSRRADDANLPAASPAGRVRGRLLREGDGAAVASFAATLGRGGAAVAGVPSAADGRYALPLLVPGPFDVRIADPEGVVVAEALGLTSSPGEVVTRDFSLPARQAVTVTVRRNGTVLPGATVTLTSDHPTALPSDRQRQGTTDGAGRLTAVLPVGGIVALAVDPGTQATAQAAGTLVLAAPLELAIDFGAPPADVFGTVFAADGLTPLPGAVVSLPGFGSRATDGLGNYRFEDLPAATYTLAAEFGGITTTGEVTLNGVDARRDLTLRVAGLSGRLTESDGTGLAAAWRACGFTLGGFACIEGVSAPSGDFVRFGLPDWSNGSSALRTVSLSAWLLDGSTVTASGSFTYQDTGTLITTSRADLAFPPLGDVSGVVRDAVAEPVPGALVDCGAGQFTADGQGRYRCPHVPVGEVRAWAEHPATRVPGEAAANLTAGQELDLDITLVPTATLSISLFEAGGGGRLEAIVAVDTPEVLTRSGSAWATAVGTLATGDVSVVVPAGLVRAVYGDSCGDTQATAVEADTLPGSTVGLALTRGSHLTLPQELGGPLGSYVAFAAPGDIGCAEVSGAPIPEVTGPAGYRGVVEAEAEARALRTLTEPQGGLRFRRQDYVPPSGAFSRRLLLVANPGATARGVDLQTLLFATTTTVAATGSGDTVFDTTDSYGVFADPSTGRAEALVIGQVLAPTAAEACLNGECGYTVTAFHTLTVPPGSTRALLVFYVRRDGGDVAGVAAQAQALAALADPDALVGLTAGDRTAIVNFVVPQP